MRSKALLFKASALLLMLAACSTDRYAGIDLREGLASPEIQALARLSQEGDKEAQLALGIRYELGQGVAVDFERARRLYSEAAKNSGGQIYAYSPSPGNGAPARVLAVDRPVTAGLIEARRRLQAIDRKGRAR